MIVFETVDFSFILYIDCIEVQRLGVDVASTKELLGVGIRRLQSTAECKRELKELMLSWEVRASQWAPMLCGFRSSKEQMSLKDAPQATDRKSVV